MIRDLSYYVHCFTHLRRDARNGGAPHKPVLLLSIIEMFEQGIFSGTHITVVPELVASFRTRWTELVTTNHRPVFSLPFFHLKSEPFWNLIAKFGFEKWLDTGSSIRTLRDLLLVVDRAEIDAELFVLLMIAENRDVLKISILDRYFSSTRNAFESTPDLGVSRTLLEDSSEEYQRKIIELKRSVDDNSFQEEVFVRSGLFKKEIPKIYDNMCSISGLRVDATFSISMVDACHIVPFSEGFDDSVTNGLALCPNLHRAFDRGLISVSDDYEVLLNKNFIERSDSPYNISQFERRKLRLPNSENHRPSLANIALHRTKHGY